MAVNPMPPDAAVTVAYNSAELKAILDCVLLNDFNKCPPCIHAAPLVDLRVFRQPAQFESEYTVK